MSTIDFVAETLFRAQKNRKSCPPPSATHKMSVEDAYAVQAQNIARRLVGDLSGDEFSRDKTKVVGHKIGLTSRAIQEWLKVSQPDFGHLLADMNVRIGGQIETASLISPRCEGEVAFVLGQDLCGPGLTAADVIGATDYVLAAIEVVDSRVADWEITYEDTIADNASSGMFILSSKPTSLRDIDLELCGMALRKNGEVVATGAGVACLGHPVNAVVWLANQLGRLGQKLEAGHIILSGALGPVCDVQAGDVIDLDISGLGSARVSFC